MYSLLPSVAISNGKFTQPSLSLSLTPDWLISCMLNSHSSKIPRFMWCCTMIWHCLGYKPVVNELIPDRFSSNCGLKGAGLSYFYGVKLLDGSWNITRASKVEKNPLGFTYSGVKTSWSTPQLFKFCLQGSGLSCTSFKVILRNCSPGFLNGTARNSRDDPLLCLQLTVSLGKNPF